MPKFAKVYSANESKITALLSDLQKQCTDAKTYIAVLELLCVTLEMEMDRLVDQPA